MTLDEAVAEFNRCWPWLDASIARYGRTHNKEHLWDEICDKRSYFFPGKECAIVCRIFRHPTGMKTLHIWLAGGKLTAVRELYSAVEEWGRQMGCHRMTATGRKGWLRALPDWHEQGTQRVKSLVDDDPLVQGLVDEYKKGAILGMRLGNENFLGLATELDP